MFLKPVLQVLKTSLGIRGSDKVFTLFDLLVYIMTEGVGVQLPDLVHLGIDVLVELVVEQDPADGQAELAKAAEGDEGVGADGDVLGVLLANPVYTRRSSISHKDPEGR